MCVSHHSDGRQADDRHQDCCDETDVDQDDLRHGVILLIICISIIGVIIIRIGLREILATRMIITITSFQLITLGHCAMMINLIIALHLTRNTARPIVVWFPSIKTRPIPVHLQINKKLPPGSG